MAKVRWCWLLGTLGALASLAVACEDDSSPGNLSQPGNAGSGGQTGEGGTAGKPGGCDESADCKSFGDCSTLAELQAQCENDELARYATKCGGQYIESTGGVTASSWLFDAQGQLIGGSYEDEGSCSSWGATCATIGKGEPLCDAGPQCVSHDTCQEWGANIACPDLLGEIYALCGLGGGEISIERSNSDCGGTVVRADTGVQTSWWSFNLNGQLIGARSIGDVGDCDYWGEECQPVGVSQLVCGEGGAGGSGGQGVVASGGAAVGQGGAP